MTFRHPYAVLGAVSGAFGAFAAAAMIASAAAPTAHADDTATLLADLTAVEGEASTAFTTAATELANPATEADGLTQLFIGLDDDLFNIPNLLQVGLLDEIEGVDFTQSLSNFEVSSALPFDFATPTATGYIAEANTIYTEGATTLINTITGLPATDFADTAMDNTLSFLDQFILPGQIEAIASLAFGL
jgi:hypothetical protein